jgi:hypothetical protein
VFVAGAVMTLAVSILVAGHRRSARSAAALLVSLIAVSELLAWNTAFRLNSQPRSEYAVLEAPTGVEAGAIAVLESAIAADHRRGDRPRLEVLGLGGPWQNLAMVRGWEAINGYNPLRIGVYDRLVSPGEENWSVDHRQFPLSFDNYDCSLARALGLTYLVMGRPLDQLPHLEAPPAAELLLKGPPVWIYRLEGAMPRAYLSPWPPGARGATATSLGSGAEASIDINLRASYDGSKASPPAEAPGLVHIEQFRANSIQLRTTSTNSDVLVLNDLYYPGWTVEIDGTAAPILRIGLLFRGVAVPAGSHRVTFRFEPFSRAAILPFPTRSPD